MLINELAGAVALTYKWPNYIAPSNKILPSTAMELDGYTAAIVLINMH